MREANRLGLKMEEKRGLIRIIVRDVEADLKPAPMEKMVMRRGK